MPRHAQQNADKLAVFVQSWAVKPTESQLLGCGETYSLGFRVSGV